MGTMMKTNSAPNGRREPVESRSKVNINQKVLTQAGKRTFIDGDGRRRRLLRRKPTGPWYLRLKIDGRQIWRSLETTEPQVAIVKARKIVAAELNGEPKEARELKARPGYATLRQLADVYIERFGTDARRRRTARNNVGALQKILYIARRLTLEQARANVLTGELIRKFETAMEQTIERDRRGFMDHKNELRVRTSTQSWVKQARSIFRRGTMSWFDGLAVPDLTSFREQGVRAPERENPERLDENVIEALNAAAPALAAENPACYIAFLLFSRLGLRNGEQKAARMAWIHRDPDTGAGKLAIIKRPEEQFKPKKSSRTLTIGATLLAEIDKHWKPSPDGDYLIPAGTKTERGEIIDRQHAAWCGQWIKDRSKVSYELRRYAGSMVYKKTGKIEYVRQFLGHADLKTTLEWYFYLLNDMPAVDLQDFAAS
jgi:hypothetical protein